MASYPWKPAPVYRGRLAPSPTGYLHVGHARTFWMAWQRAREAGGTLVMRMEDLDSERSRAAYAEAALEDLRWLGIDWQEGPDCGGPFGPYLQSERRALYLQAWRDLLRGGYLFPCRCSRKDIEAATSAPHEGVRGGAQSGKHEPDEPPDDEPIYPGTCRNLREHAAQILGSTAVATESPEGIHWRFRVPDGEVVEFDDRNLGPQRFVAGKDFGDFLVWRRDGGAESFQQKSHRERRIGTPSYQLACVVDDAAMHITEVVRGADLLKSTARQILLNRALGYKNPAWYHCRLMQDASGRRMAKRHDALSLRTLRQRGVTPSNVLSGELPPEF